MTATRWEELRNLFDHLVDLPPPEQRSALAAVVDDELRIEVESLLAAERSAGSRFDLAPVLPGAFDDAPAESLDGMRIGAYRVTREIGRGGMGAVYEAHRDDAAFTKRVAIKMISGGRDTEQVRRRFHHERRILARLEHPNIAALLDGGVTDDGRSYFAMEFVEGERIDRYCASRALDIRDRIALVCQVCTAVHFAHQHLVIHRDIKPGNILVTADGTVKLLDFGIAKLLDPGDTDDSALTGTGVLPMTLMYSSPEQRRGRPVTTATDIYSLGVVLYELLSGQRPFGEAHAIDEADRLPIAPSRVATDRRVQRTLAGDLDSVILKALRPEPALRYGTAELLADDLRNHLAGTPVLARSGALNYRAGKFVRRHAGAVTAGILAVAALIVATIVSVHQAGVARAERDRALREAQRTQQVTAFFQDVFASAKPDRLGSGVTVVQAIDSAIARADSAFRSEPDLHAAIKLTLGSTLTNMYLYQRARPLLEDALRLRRDIDGDAPSRDKADALFDLGSIESEIGDAGKAESLFRSSLSMRGRLGAVDSARIYEGMSNVAEALLNQGKLKDAAALYDTVAKALDRLRPQNVELRATTRANMGTAMSQLGRYAEAEPVLREAVRLFEQARGPTSPAVASALQPLAGTLVFNGKFAEAEQVARRGVAINEKEFGRTNPATLSAMRQLTSAMVESGRCGAALPMIREMLALRGKVMSETDPTLGVALLQLGQCQLEAGQLPASEATLRDALTVRIATFGEDHWAVAQVRSLLGEVLGRRKRDAEAEAMLRKGLAGLRTGLAPGHVRIEQARVRLESFLRARGRPPEPGT